MDRETMGILYVILVVLIGVVVVWAAIGFLVFKAVNDILQLIGKHPALRVTISILVALGLSAYAISVIPTENSLSSLVDMEDVTETEGIENVSE